jgi:hypothetical protein
MNTKVEIICLDSGHQSFDATLKKPVIYQIPQTTQGQTHRGLGHTQAIRRLNLTSLLINGFKDGKQIEIDTSEINHGGEFNTVPFQIAWLNVFQPQSLIPTLTMDLDANTQGLDTLAKGGQPGSRQGA